MSSENSDPVDPSSEPPAKKQKTIAPQRLWVFTWNNYPETWASHFSVHQAPEGKLAGWMGEREIAPDTGTPHIQGWIDFGINKKGRPFSLKMPEQICWKKMRGTPEQNFTYCSKEDVQYIAWGSCINAKPLIIHMDWDRAPWMKKLYDILCQDPNSRDIRWIWEPLGNAGKTFFCKWFEIQHKGEVLVLAGKAHDMKNGIVEWKEKFGSVPRVILINIPRDKKNEHISWSGVEEVKDMLFFSGKFHGGMVNDKHPHIVFMANWEPDTTHMSGDRYLIHKIPNGQGAGDPRYESWEDLGPKVEECARFVPAKFPGFVVQE